MNSPEHNEQEKELVDSWPGRMKSEGFETVQIQTTSGGTIQIRIRYYRRVCDRRNGKRPKGLYAGLALLGIHDRCTPVLAAMISAWSALLSSFEEVRQVLCDHGVGLNVKVIRKLAYRYAERARVGGTDFFLDLSWNGTTNFFGLRVKTRVKICNTAKLTPKRV